ncbi:MAG: ABC transporter ATP-binding protein [Asgard group archaeon]|nr:ABC transporter ATP-binding protein [Asgard group archaeon]
MIEDEITVEAVHLQKLFPVVSGFFESIFSIETMKRTGRATKQFFSSVFSKDRKKTFKELTKEYFGVVFQRSEKHYVHAVDDISFKIHKGETFGLVGESGCGKSTTGMLLLNLLETTGGHIYFKSPDSITLTRKQIRGVRIKKEKEKLTLTRRQKKLLRGKEERENIILNEEQINNIIATEGFDQHETSSRWEKMLVRITNFLNSLLLKPNRIFLTEEQLLSIGTVSRVDISNFTNRELKNLRKDIQIIFQNPYESLSPRFSILDIIAEPLRLLRIYTDEATIEKKVKEELESVGLIPAEDFIDRYPHELSGGQRQRVGVARAFILDPEFIVADEPVSMLDVSIRVGVLKIMRQLTIERGTAFLFITHDLALARVMCDRIAVMYLGRIVEQGPTEELIQKPLHPYAKALIAGVPKPDPDARRTEDLPIIGEVPSGIDVPFGCRFNPRCPYVIEKCTKVDPQLEEVGNNHLVACIRYNEINNK